MRKVFFLTISAVLMISMLAACSAEMDNTRLQGQNGSNTGTGIAYDIGRESYPGQSYANTVSDGARRNAMFDNNGGNSPNKSGSYVNTPGNNDVITETQIYSQLYLSANGGIVLRNITTPVRRGGMGSLSFEVKADTPYTITAVYRKAEGFVTSTNVKRPGTDGIVDLDWVVDEDTMPGTYGILITGGGEQLSVPYTVVE